jgi:hypothetical protein
MKEKKRNKKKEKKEQRKKNRKAKKRNRKTKGNEKQCIFILQKKNERGNSSGKTFSRNVYYWCTIYSSLPFLHYYFRLWFCGGCKASKFQTLDSISTHLCTVLHTQHGKKKSCDCLFACLFVVCLFVCCFVFVCNAC